MESTSRQGLGPPAGSLYNLIKPLKHLYHSILKAYGLAYTSTVGPKLLDVLYSLRKQRPSFRSCLKSVLILLFPL